MNVPKKYQEYFNKGSDKMSFIDLKKDLINSIKEKDWLHSDNKMLIDFPNDFKEKIGLGEGLVNLDSLDKVVGLIYS